MNLSPIAFNRKNIKYDEDFFSNEQRDPSIEDYLCKKAQSLLDIKVEVSENEEIRNEIIVKNIVNPNLNIKKETSESNIIANHYTEKRRLSRAVASNIVLELEKESLDKSNIMNNNTSLQKIDLYSSSSSSSSSSNHNSNYSSSFKSSYSYSSSSHSISIENQEKFEINNMDK